MKRTFAKRSLMSLVAGFFLFGFLLLTAGRAQAQQTIGGGYNWMTSDQAQLVLVAEVTTLYTDLAGLQPGTPAHNNKLAHAIYYRMIHRKLGEGVFISQAVEQSLDIFSGTNDAGSLSTQVDVSGVSVDAALKQELRDDAIDLLTQ